MKYLFKKNKKENEISTTSMSQNNEYIPIAILFGNQLDMFLSKSLNGLETFYDEAYRLTGIKRFTTKLDNNKCFSVKDLSIDTYLVALEALLCISTGMGGIKTLELLDYGEYKVFDENGCVVSYNKIEPLYEREHSKDINGNYDLHSGIVSLSYNSPMGNFIIKQNQINNELFEIYFSKNMSQILYKRLVSALEISLGFKHNSLEDNLIAHLDIKEIESDEYKKLK